MEEAQAELNRAKEINPTGSDLLFEIEGILKFWQDDYVASGQLLGKVKMPSPVASLFMAAAEFYSGDIEASNQRVASIEKDFGLTAQKLFAGESYRLETMKAKIAAIRALLFADFASSYVSDDVGHAIAASFGACAINLSRVAEVNS